MKVPQPIPYQGSKRNIADTIMAFFPSQFNVLMEPFAGSAAVSLAAACKRKVTRFHLNDINRPLIDLWDEIIQNPKEISNAYEKIWNEQKGRKKEYYFFIRDKFNKTKRPDYLLYLLARCVKASIRYNSKGEFNQSPDNRRKGRHPVKMRNDIFAASNLLRGKTITTSKDYCEILKSATRDDLVYMDPPYQGVCKGRDPRYYNSVNFEEFLDQLEILVSRRIPFILSYDGRKGQKTYGKELPSEIGIYRIEVDAGRSAQSTLLGKDERTFESIYLSEELANILGLSFSEITEQIQLNDSIQLPLPTGGY